MFSKKDKSWQGLCRVRCETLEAPPMDVYDDVGEMDQPAQAPAPVRNSVYLPGERLLKQINKTQQIKKEKKRHHFNMDDIHQSMCNILKDF